MDRSFHEILKEKLEPTNSKSFQGKAHESEPAFLSYLIGEIPTFSLSPSQKYAKYTKPPVSPAENLRRPHLLSEAQKLAFDFFSTLSPKLSPAFTEAELKAEFRALARKLHPDHNNNKKAADHFRQLKKAYDCLKQVINV